MKSKSYHMDELTLAVFLSETLDTLWLHLLAFNKN